MDKIRYKKLTPFNLSKFIHNKVRRRHFVLLIDEAHESSITNLEWIRTIVDSTPNLSVIFASLPIFEDNLSKKLPTLLMRINTKVYLNSLSKPETESLIMKRIENVGGDGLKPFTSESVDKIFEITGGFPREIIKICDELIKNAAEKNISNINVSFVDQTHKTTEILKPLELKIKLSGKQKNILKTLNEAPNLTPSEIIDHLDLDSYKDRNNAVRSVNNILRRLLKDEFLQRKKLGNTYVYSLSGKAKTIFIEA